MKGQRLSIEKLIKSFNFAFHGLKIAFRDEQNFKIEILIALLAVGLSIFLQISIYEWLVILFCITLVLICELLNTAIEHITDLVADRRRTSKARLAKDVAAASVLLSSIFSCVIGLIIFLPKILALL